MRMRISVKSGIIALVLMAVLVVLFLRVPSRIARYNPSDYAAYLPDTSDSFEFYISENQKRIRAALNEYSYSGDARSWGSIYSLDEVLQMRSPYQILPDSENCPAGASLDKKGFLLVHGLSDSPYLLRGVAESLGELYPCALLRGVLSAGHGTIPGDLLEVRLDQWAHVFEYGLSSLAKEVDELVVVAYSNGSALALNYLDTHRDEDLIDALVFLSPALKTADERARWTPYLRYIYKWIVQGEDSDPVKYESFPTNAAAEFYKLTQTVLSPKFQPLNTPALFIVSRDDTTIDYKASTKFFCENLNLQESTLILLNSQFGAESSDKECDAIQSRTLGSDSDRVISYSHIALSISPENIHYGINGNKPVCGAHDGFPDRLRRCLNDNDSSVYAENNYMDADGLFQGKIVRRTSFNPSYDEMIADIQCFLDKDCDTD